MTDSSLPLDAYVVIDNNVIVGLAEYFTDTYKDLAFPETINVTCQEITTTFNKLRRFALDGKILTTQIIQDEFKPENNKSLNSRRDFNHKICDQLKSHVKSEVEVCDIKTSAIEKLRSMTETPSKFGPKLKALSDPDLSLVILALGIINQTGRRVYILADEEDLRSFISWMKPKSEAKSICKNTHLLESIHSMIYMDNAHRHCAFTTMEISSIFMHYQQKQLKRLALGGTTKMGMIEITYDEIRRLIYLSGQIKQKNLAGIL